MGTFRKIVVILVPEVMQVNGFSSRDLCPRPRGLSLRGLLTPEIIEPAISLSLIHISEPTRPY